MSEDCPIPEVRAGGASRGPGIQPPVESYAQTAAAQQRMLVDHSIKKSSNVTYSSSRKQWLTFCRLTGISPFLTGEDLQWERNVLMTFFTDRAMRLNLKHKTLLGIRASITRMHVEVGLAAPCRHKLLGLLLRGVKRREGPSMNKLPVTVDLLRALERIIDTDTWDGLVTLTSITFMFLFLLRSREALSKVKPDEEQCVRVKNVRLLKGVNVVGWRAAEEADGLLLTQGATKGDQAGKGASSVLDMVPGDCLCAVAGIQKMALMRPSHFAGYGTRFLVTLDNGKVVSVGTVSALLKRVALTLGVPVGAMSVISIRAGGASGMWDAGCTEEEIKRRGKWASDSWKIYVWNGQRREKGLAASLLGTSVSLTAPVIHYLRKEQESNKRKRV